MIAFDFQYFKPSTIEEAVSQFKVLQQKGSRPVYYNGGTEIITFSRKNNIHPGAVIDLKAIPQCRLAGIHQGHYVFGSALTLNEIVNENGFPFLSAACRHTADHTSRNKITIGGNVCGKIIYKEASLPLLIADADALVAGDTGLRRMAVNHMVQSRTSLQESDFVVQFLVAERFLRAPFVYIKKTKQEKIAYPLISMAAMKSTDGIRVAFSGLCSFPFRSQKIEAILNDVALPNESKIEQAIEAVPGPVLNDILGSADYRIFLLENLLQDLLHAVNSG